MDVLQPEVYRGAPVVFIMTGLARALSQASLAVQGGRVMPLRGKWRLKSSKPLPSCCALTLLLRSSWNKHF